MGASPSTWQRFSRIEEIYLDTSEVHSPVHMMAAMSLPAEAKLDVAYTFAKRVVAHHPRFSARVVTRPRCLGLGERREFETVEGFEEKGWQKHVILHEDEVQGKREERQKQFHAIVERILTSRVDPTKPLWELHWIPGWAIGTENNDGVTLLFRVHHCVADGLAMVDYLVRNVADQDEGVRSHTRKKVGPERRKAVKTINRDAGVVFRVFWPLFLGLWVVWMFLRALGATLSVLWNDPETVLTRGPIGPKKVFSITPPEMISVDILKKAARSQNYTINDVLMTALTGALRCYLVERGESPSKIGDIYCGVALNKRLLDSAPAAMNNEHTVIFLRLPTGEGDAALRLSKMRKRMDELKAGFMVPLVELGHSILCLFPAGVRRKMWWKVTGRLSLAVSNVKGPEEGYSVGGYPVTGVSVFAPADGKVGLVGSIVSYRGNISATFASDAGRVSDPGRLTDLFVNEINSFIIWSKTEGNVEKLAT